MYLLFAKSLLSSICKAPSKYTPTHNNTTGFWSSFTDVEAVPERWATCLRHPVVCNIAGAGTVETNEDHPNEKA